MSRETIPVTVILTHYRRPYTVVKALMSLAEQTVRPANLIFIDDHSPLPEYQLFHEHAASIIPFDWHPWFYRTPFNFGLGKARNMAVGMANKPYVAFMDDDDTWHPEKLELQYKAFWYTFDLSFCFTWAMRGGVKKFPAYRGEYIFDDLYLGQRINHVPAPTMMISRFWLAQAGGWGRTRHAEDFSTALRLSVVGRAYCVDKPLIYSDPDTPSLSRSRPKLYQVVDYLRALTEGARFAVACGHKLPVPLAVRYKQVLTNYMKGQIVRLIK